MLQFYKKRALTGLLLWAVVWGIPVACWGQIVQYSFIDAIGSEADFAADAQPTNGSASLMRRGSGITASANSERFNATAWNTVGIDADDYFEFTVNPNSLAAMSLMTIQLDERRSDTGIRKWSVRSNLDAYTTDLTVFNVPDNNNIRNQTINLTPAFLSLTTGVTFRIYGYDAENSGGSWWIDNLKVYGSIQFQYTLKAGATSWSASNSWNPSRNIRATNDVLIFDGNVQENYNLLADFASPETLGQLLFINGVNVTLITAADRVLNLTNTTAGENFAVESGSTLTLTNSASDADLQINLQAGASGIVEGIIVFRGNHDGAEHKLTSVNENGIRFSSGSKFIAESKFTNHAFGTSVSNKNSVHFESGSSYVSKSGAHPFGLTQPNSVVVFQTGSLYKHEQVNDPSFGGRTYADFELNLALPTSKVSITAGSNSACTVGNLTISKGIIEFPLSLNNLPSDINIENSLIVTANGTFDYNPGSAAAASILKFNGTTPQVIGGSGTITVGSDATLEVDNTTSGNSVYLQRNLTVEGTIRMTDGLLQTNSNTLTLGPVAQLVESETARIVGTVKTTRTLSQHVNHAFGGLGLEIKALGASPGSTTVTRVTGPTAERTGQNENKSIHRYFTISPSTDIGLNATLIFKYFDAEVAGSDASLVLFCTANNGVNWTNERGVVASETNAITRTGINRFADDWTAADANLPLPVVLRSFTGKRMERVAQLEWTTSSEKNNAGFEVERSADAIQFEAVGFVAASASPRAVNHYAFTDDGLGQGHYYRLRQLDVDGQYTFSKTLFVEGKTTASLWPNPAPATNRLHLSLPTKNAVLLQLFSPNGLLLRQTEGFPDEIEAALNQWFGVLPSGLYFLHIRQDGRWLPLRLVKQ